MWFWRLLGLGDANRHERLATFWVAVMAFASLASMNLLQPIRNQFGVDRGVEGMPYLYTLTLLGTVVLVVPFWALADRMPSRRFVPLSLQIATGALLAVAAGLWVVGDYDWNTHPWIGELFWGGLSALNVALPALIWIHAVEHFGKQQAKRLFGLIAVGATLGVVAGSWGFGLRGAPPWLFAVVAALLLQVMRQAFFASMSYCLRLDGGDTREHVARGGLLEGLRIVVADRRALQIALYVMLVGFVATAFWTAQTALVKAEIDDARSQHEWFADVKEYGNLLVLAVQLFGTGRMMTRLPAWSMLAALPVLSIVGLSVYWLVPTAFGIFCVQIARSGANYAVEKPAREVLYTPLALATKHKVKFLIDTFALRLGDLLGAIAQAWMYHAKLSVGAIVAVTVVFTLVWIGLAVSLGRDQRPRTSPIASIS
ncbi:MAG: hypothetical protein H6835_04670 [Planctomycetes bacterium]|nr:hypothetical protein [Planctomycetota bacterium]